MNAIPRKRRMNLSIEKSSKLFSEFVANKEYKKAGLVVLWCLFKEFAKEGILNALDDANSFIERKKIEKIEG